VKKYTDAEPPQLEIIFLRFVPRMKKKKKFIASVSEERRGVFSAYESLFICQYFGGVMKEAGPLQIICSYIVIAYLSGTPCGSVEAVHLRLM
jgi:hypothetical protein